MGARLPAFLVSSPPWLHEFRLTDYECATNPPWRRGGEMRREAVRFER
jgi:hypothetical protein